MRKRNIILLAIGSLIVTALGGAITYYDVQAENLQGNVTVSEENSSR